LKLDWLRSALLVFLPPAPLSSAAVLAFLLLLLPVVWPLRCARSCSGLDGRCFWLLLLVRS